MAPWALHRGFVGGYRGFVGGYRGYYGGYRGGIVGYAYPRLYAPYYYYPRTYYYGGYYPGVISSYPVYSGCSYPITTVVPSASFSLNIGTPRGQLSVMPTLCQAWHSRSSQSNRHPPHSRGPSIMMAAPANPFPCRVPSLLP